MTEERCVKRVRQVGPEMVEAGTSADGAVLAQGCPAPRQPMSARAGVPLREDTEMKTVIVLQGGGATGSWQAGVLESLLESAQFRSSVISVIGTSIGGLNGALLVQRLNHAHAQHLRKPATHQGMWESEVGWDLLCRSRLRRIVRRVCRPRLLVQGPTYFMTTAAVVRGRICAMGIRKGYDMWGPQEGGLHVFQFGPTHSDPPHNALRALLSTSAVPWLYGPIRHDKWWMSDGGLLANLPCDLIARLRVDAFVLISPNPPSRRLSWFPVSRNIESSMRRRLDLLLDIARRRRSGPVPVYHLHPGWARFEPPGMLDFSPTKAQRAFANGYTFGEGLRDWNHACLNNYRVTGTVTA